MKPSTCSNCKYWDTSDNIPHFGECKKLVFYDGPEEGLMFDRVYEGGCDYGTLFGENFGCIHFEDKDA